jgi:hypothetical protein
MFTFRLHQNICQKKSIVKGFSQWLSTYINLNEYKRIQLASDSQKAGMDMTPELHIANAIIKAGFCGLLAIPAFFIFPLITPLGRSVSCHHVF